jgi:hypothetical protein
MSSVKLPTKPSMKETEIACLKAHLEGTRKYLEFGCGGSTILAAEMGLPKLYSVESDKFWADEVRNSPLVKPLVEQGDYLVKWVDIGPTKEWGHPADPATAIKWPNYSTAIWREISGPPDFILVDGRFRLSCALQSIARCSDVTKIAVHDFERKQYQYILKYTHIVEQVDNLAILRRRQSYDQVQFALDCADNLLNAA